MPRVTIDKQDSGFIIMSEASRTSGRSEQHAVETFEKAARVIATLLDSAGEYRPDAHLEKRSIGQLMMAVGEKKLTYDELRDELGETRRLSERRREKLDDTITVNARLVKDHSALEKKYDDLARAHDALAGELNRIESLQQNTKPAAKPKAKPRKR